MISVVLEVSLLVAPMILLLLFLATRFGAEYSASARKYLWLILAIRLLIPIGFTGQRLITVDLPSEPVAATAVGGYSPRFADTENQDIIEAPQPNQPQPAKPVHAYTWRHVVYGLWMLGAAGFLVYHLIAYISMRRKLLRWSVKISDKKALALFEDLRREYCINKDIRLLHSPCKSPLLFGFFRPTVVLPKNSLYGGQLDTVLRHELMHYKRRDLWYKLIMLLAAAAHWFNPFVHLMARRAELDVEASCDAAVLRDAKSHDRRAYGFAILSELENQRPSYASLTTGFCGKKQHLIQRFSEIADASVRKKGYIPIALTLAISLCCGILVGCDSAPPTEPDSPSTAESSLIFTEEAGSAPPTEPDSPSTTESSLILTEEAGPAPDDSSLNAVLQNDDAELHLGSMEEFEQYFSKNKKEYEAQEKEIQGELDRVYQQISWDDSSYAAEGMLWPTSFPTVASGYGWRFDGRDYHTGIDISGEGIYGAPVYAADNGTVAFVNLTYKEGAGFGIYLLVDHGGGISTLYAQLSNVTVQVGDTVERGQVIAQVGSTGRSAGPHLHFEVRINGAHTDPMAYITVHEDSGILFWPTDSSAVTVCDSASSGVGPLAIDIAGSAGDNVYAANYGTVILAQNMNVGYGQYLIIDHGDGYQTLYAHNQELLVDVGDVVEGGQTIAKIGRSGFTTGYTLHFEVSLNGKQIDPLQYVSKIE